MVERRNDESVVAERISLPVLALSSRFVMTEGTYIEDSASPSALGIMKAHPPCAGPPPHTSLNVSILPAPPASASDGAFSPRSNISILPSSISPTALR